MDVHTQITLYAPFPAKQKPFYEMQIKPEINALKKYLTAVDKIQGGKQQIPSVAMKPDVWVTLFTRKSLLTSGKAHCGVRHYGTFHHGLLAERQNPEKRSHRCPEHRQVPLLRSVQQRICSHRGR